MKQCRCAKLGIIGKAEPCSFNTCLALAISMPVNKVLRPLASPLIYPNSSMKINFFHAFFVLKSSNGA